MSTSESVLTRKIERSAPLPPRKVTAAELLQGRKSVLIQHNGSEYRLQLTRSKKLILTK